jgi:hypothetical protein
MFVATQLLTAHNDNKLRCCASSFVELLKVTILKIFRKSTNLYFICKADLTILFVCNGASERQTGNLICHIIYLFAFGKGNCLVKMCEDFKQVSHALNRLQLRALYVSPGYLLGGGFCLFKPVESFHFFACFLCFAPNKKDAFSARWNKVFFMTKTISVLRKIIRHLKQIIRHLFFRRCRIIFTFLRAKNGEKIVEITPVEAISTL